MKFLSIFESDDYWLHADLVGQYWIQGISKYLNKEAVQGIRL